MDLLLLLGAVEAAVLSIPSDRSPLTLRLALAESCDIAIEFLKSGIGPRGFHLNGAQTERLVSAAKDFRLSDTERGRLGANEGESLRQVEDALRAAVDRLLDGTHSSSDAKTLVGVLDRTRTLLRQS